MLIHNISGVLATPDPTYLIKLLGAYLSKYGSDASGGGLNHPLFRDTMKAIFGKDAFKIIGDLAKEGKLGDSNAS